MKFIDLIDEIHKNTSGEVYRSELIEILQYLDRHPEMTERDRMESELKAISDRTRVSLWAVKAVTTALGHGIIPDPEPKPTNVDRLAEILRSIHDQASPEYVAESLDELGVVAPEDDDG